MKVLVACEFSGRVRDAFTAKGHDAVSCDIFFSETPGPHLKCKVEKLLNKHWDLIIGFPPCTYLSCAGQAWNKVYPWRLQEAEKGLKFFLLLANANINKICLENPVGIVSTRYRKPDQIIQPWQFGHGETKKTCLWLKNLPLLIPTNVVNGRRSKVQHEPGGREQARNRSRTYTGIATAMAEQWG